MGAKNFSVLLAGLIWMLVGLRIGLRAVPWLTPYISDIDFSRSGLDFLMHLDPKLALFLASIIIAILKAKTVLKKAFLRNMGNLDKISESPHNYLTGWLILYGVKGSVMISIMIGIGFALRYLRGLGLDTHNIFGFIYLGIALGLFLAGFYYINAFSLAMRSEKKG
jgi:hypothetical protein